MIAPSLSCLKRLFSIATCVALGAMVARAIRAESAGDRQSRPGEAAAAAMEAGRYGRALTLIEKGLEGAASRGVGAEEFEELLRLEATVHFRRGDAEGAVTSLRRLWSRAPREPTLDEAALLAECLLVMGDAAGAAQILAPLEKRLEHSAHARFLLAEALAQEGRTDEARRLLRVLGKERPLPEALFRLGMISFDEGAHEDALRLFRRTIALRERDYYARIYAARSLLELKRNSEAVSVLEEARGLARTAEVYYLLGNAAMRSGKPREAVECYETAVRLQAGYTEAYFGLAKAQRQLGGSQPAGETLQRFHELHQRDQELLETAGRLEQSCRAHPEDAGERERLSRLYLDHGREQEAERWAWKALRLEPRRLEARLLLARALRQQGLLSRAAVHYQKILRQEPRHAAARSELETMIRRHGARKS